MQATGQNFQSFNLNSYTSIQCVKVICAYFWSFREIEISSTELPSVDPKMVTAMCHNRRVVYVHLPDARGQLLELIAYTVYDWLEETRKQAAVVHQSGQAGVLKERMGHHPIFNVLKFEAKHEGKWNAWICIGRQ